MPEVWFPNLGIEIEKLPKVAFSLFGQDIYMYALCITLGVVVGYLLAEKEARRLGMQKDIIIDFLTVAMIFAIVGARLYYVIFSWDSYKNDLLKIFNIREGGMAVYGTIIAEIFVVYFFAKRRKIDVFDFMDLLVPSLAIGQAIGRWGNFFNREVFGRYTENIFAMRYIADQVSTIPESVAKHILNIDGVEYIQVEPTFLYESLWNFGVFFILIYLQKHKKFSGQVVAVYFLLYGIGRTWIELIRTDQLLVFGFPVSVIVSLLFIIFSLFIMIKKSKNGGKVQ